MPVALNIRQTKIGTPPRRIDFDKHFPGAVPTSGGTPRFREWLVHKSWADSRVVGYFHVLTGAMYTEVPHEYVQVRALVVSYFMCDLPIAASHPTFAAF